ncbi:hypothetical protein KQX54_021272 [Cotesia glomerata]|uniref:GBD/FH3 domain-containing protein n=1 Tax=Cotesia glomerata TaxID=32391 RepID=A0AAV7I2W9_COTGL|nr:hypothetical protein KQX54_021272 [Cotesia glomerata]
MNYLHQYYLFIYLSSYSKMSPNAEEDMLTVEPWSLLKEKDRLRPPTYNAEDYAIALRRWGRRPNSNDNDSQGTLPSTTSSSSGYMSASGEMTLRQFTSVSELVNKLRADLRLAFPSFVQEFSSSPADGITLLLETLRGVQLIQSTPPSAGQSGQRISTRRAALDELGCVECLAACVERCADAPRLLSQAQPGLVALAVCLTSSLNRSRVLALQLLTKVCQIPGGYTAVSEAVSTLRLRYGEGGRFRFLAGALLAPRAAIALRVAGISFLNAFIKSAPKTQTKLYIQAEACEAGLEPRALQEWLSEDEIINNDKSLIDLLKKQVYKWSQNCIDVDSLQKRLARAEETYIKGLQRLSLNGEDEGISSSECSRSSSSPEDIHLYNHHHHHHHHHYHKQQQHKSIIEKTNIDNDQETTIDDVIEELRTIVKDAEEEQEQEQKQKQIQVRIDSIDFNDTEVNYCNKTNDITKLSRQTIKTNDVTSLKIIVQGPEVEEAIVPAILYPQPPRKIPPCLSAIITGNNQSDDFLENNNKNQNNDDDHNINNENKCTTDDEIFADENDSLLSAAQLKYRDDDNDHHLYKNEDGGLYLNTASNLTEPAEYLELELFENSDNNDNNRIIKNRVEKKKLQRSVSQNNLDDSKNLNPSKLTTTKIEDRIKKFERNEFNLNNNNNNSIDRSSNLNNDGHINDLSIIRSYSYKKKPSDKLFINDSRIFSTASNKSHGGAFGLNQNRFNAGKYSGNPNIKGDKIESKIKTVSSNHIINRCKVTDIISGLY